MTTFSIRNDINDDTISDHSELIKIIYKSFKLVYSNLGIGHSESIYHKALLYELSLHHLSIDSERNLNVIYTDSKGNNHIVGSERIDLFIHKNTVNGIDTDNIILELKAIPKSVGDKEIFQLKKYFRELKKEKTTFEYGIIINFNQTSVSKNDCNFMIIKEN